MPVKKSLVQKFRSAIQTCPAVTVSSTDGNNDLWAAHALAVALLRPWERHLKPDPEARISPSKKVGKWH